MAEEQAKFKDHLLIVNFKLENSKAFFVTAIVELEATKSIFAEEGTEEAGIANKVRPYIKNVESSYTLKRATELEIDWIKAKFTCNMERFKSALIDVGNVKIVLGMWLIKR